MMVPARGPDFVIAGAMKCATTTAFRWLGEHPDVWLPKDKEPNFFSHAEPWARGRGWYRSLFAPAPSGAVTGEASTTYLDPAAAPTVAKRLRTVVPAVRLLCFVRDPVERALSHYWHAVRVGEEHRHAAAALAEPGNVYVRRSRYGRGVRPFLEVFGPARLLVVVADDLAADSDDWQAVLAHLGLGPHVPSGTRHNVHDHGSRLRRPALALTRTSIADRLRGPPGPLRRLAGTAMVRRPSHGEARRAEVPAGIRSELAADARALADDLGWAAAPWAWCR